MYLSVSTFLPNAPFVDRNFRGRARIRAWRKLGCAGSYIAIDQEGLEISGRAAGGDGVPASFDCAMRKAAYSFGQKLLPRLGKFSELYYALDLNRSCGTHPLVGRAGCEGSMRPCEAPAQLANIAFLPPPSCDAARITTFQHRPLHRAQR